jgi:hypothetical protein
MSGWGCNVNSNGRILESKDPPLLSLLGPPPLLQAKDPISEATCPFPMESLSRRFPPGPQAWAFNNSRRQGLTQPFIRAGDHAPSGPAAAQVGSPSQLCFRETLPPG